MLLCNLSTLPGFDDLILSGLPVLRAIEKVKGSHGKEARGGAMRAGSIDFAYHHKASDNFIVRFAAAGESDPTADSSDAGKSAILVIGGDELRAILASATPAVPAKTSAPEMKAKTA